MTVRRTTALLALLLAAPTFVGRSAAADIAASGLDRIIDRDYASLDSLYRDLHTHPEPSLHEEETARRIASELKAAGFEVTTGVGGNGVVAVLRNGKGPTVMWRSDLDALPVKEETGAFANVDVRVYGLGGHGASPHKTVDPIVMAARIVMALQTIVAREIDPIEPAVLTVGSIHGGTKHNIIPDTVDLQLTVRSYTDETRKKLLDGIRRNVLAEAQGAGAPTSPDIGIGESTPATVNDPDLVRRTVAALKKTLGDDRVVEVPPVMGSEDFTYYGREGIPVFMFNLGTIAQERIDESGRPGGRALPSLHSSQYAPERDGSIRGGVRAALVAVLGLLRPR